MKHLLVVLILIAIAFQINAQSSENKSDSICYALSIFYKDSDLYCKYDTLIDISNNNNDSSIVFALGYIELDGISTPAIDVYISESLKRFKLVRQDTLLTDDCVPCLDPREIESVFQRNHKGNRQLFVKCSYFYLRHGLAGTIYRSFIYNLNEYPVGVYRNYDEELEYRSSNIGEIK